MMNLRIQRRTFVRIITFAISFLLIFAVFAYTGAKQANAAKLQLEYQYVKSLDDLTTYMNNIDATLLKAMYSNDSNTMNELSAELWRDSGFAKDCLSALPIGYLQLEGTYKFLSQLGEYTKSLSARMSEDETLKDEDRENLASLKEYSDQFLQEVLAIQDAVQTGSLSLQKVQDDIEQTDDLDSSPVSITDGFRDFEEGLESYPTLIYDGPFSDNLLERDPLILKGKDTISEQEARSIAEKTANTSNLTAQSEEDSTMESYCFGNEDLSIAVTKQGGYVSYLLTSSPTGKPKLSEESCIEKAEAFLEEQKLDEFQQTYYEISDSVITINYAGVQDDILCYTDLVKVSVSMVSGEVTSYDARGYLTNHTKRKELDAKLTTTEAMAKVSPLLTVKKAGLCVIPTGGISEKFCYELQCVSESGDDVLVYINAKTGKEEQLLILYVDENGTLTI